MTEGTQYCHVMDSPVGPLWLTHDGQGLTGLAFHGGAGLRGRPRRALERCEWRAEPGPFAAVIRQLQQYFDGERRSFDLPLAPEAGFGGGLPIKQQLLALERSVVMRQGLHTGMAMQLPLENLL
jgi:O6-methylguanine-DNA--protein-cysteine methyltransferase